MSSSFIEIGTNGLFRQGGGVYEEFLTELRWPRAAKIYKEMASNDPTIGAILYMAEQLISKATWKVVAASQSNADMQAKVFVEQCMSDMSITWNDFIGEILTELTYGWSWHEIVYKKRGSGKSKSKYNDGRIGWAKIAGRSQETMHQWVFNEETGVIEAMDQRAMYDAVHRRIPLAKSLLFRTKVVRDNPEGRSLLRNAYRPWYFKKHIEEIEGIGIERDLAGLPVLVPPDGVNIWDPDDELGVIHYNNAVKLVTNIRRDQNEGIVLPFGWELTLMNTGSKRQFDTNAILNRYDQRIAITMLSDIVMLGADKVGSFALANVKKSLLASSLEAQLNSIVSVLNKYAIPQLIDFNAFPGITGYPTFSTSEIEVPDLTELGAYIKDLSGAKMPLFPDVDLEEYLRQVGNMPKVPLGPDGQPLVREVVEEPKEQKPTMPDPNKPKEDPTDE